MSICAPSRASSCGTGEVPEVLAHRDPQPDPQPRRRRPQDIARGEEPPLVEEAVGGQEELAVDVPDLAVLEQRRGDEQAVVARLLDERDDRREPVGLRGELGQARVVEPDRDLGGEVLEEVAGQPQLGEDDEAGAFARGRVAADRGGRRGSRRAGRAAARSGRARSGAASRTEHSGRARSGRRRERPRRRQLAEHPLLLGHLARSSPRARGWTSVYAARPSSRSCGRRRDRGRVAASMASRSRVAASSVRRDRGLVLVGERLASPGSAGASPCSAAGHRVRARPSAACRISARSSSAMPRLRSFVAAL